MMESVVQALAEPLGQLLVILLNAAVVLALKWINDHIKSKRAVEALQLITSMATTTVAGLNQEVVDALRNDGKFDAEEKKRIKAMAMSDINKQLNPTVKKVATLMVNDVDALISREIERAVGEAKKAPTITATGMDPAAPLGGYT